MVSSIYCCMHLFWLNTSVGILACIMGCVHHDLDIEQCQSLSPSNNELNCVKYTLFHIDTGKNILVTMCGSISLDNSTLCISSRYGLLLYLKILDLYSCNGSGHIVNWTKTVNRLKIDTVHRPTGFTCWSEVSYLWVVEFCCTIPQSKLCIITIGHM